MISFAGTHAAEIEPYCRQAQQIHGPTEGVNHFIVHGALVQRMRVANDRYILGPEFPGCLQERFNAAGLTLQREGFAFGRLHGREGNTPVLLFELRRVHDW